MSLREAQLYDSFILPTPALARNVFRCGNCGSIDIAVQASCEETTGIITVLLGCPVCGNAVHYESTKVET